MRVLISGGIKTQNIVDGLEKRFASDGVDFLVVPYIEDIEDIFARGEYFDRALIIEPCWNHDLDDLDEMRIRTRINNFAQNSAARQTKGVDYIFLAQKEESASIVYEEILRLKADSVVVVKAPKYGVNFFASLVVCDIEQFPDNIVYTPELVEAAEEAKIVETTNENESYTEYIPEEVDDISSELFNSEGISAPGLELSDTGVIVDREENEDLFEGDSALWDNDFGTTLNNDELDDIRVDEEEFSTDSGETDVELVSDSDQSGELPDFSQVGFEPEQVGLVTKFDQSRELPDFSQVVLGDEQVDDVTDDTGLEDQRAMQSMLLDDDLYGEAISSNNYSTSDKSAQPAFDDAEYLDTVEDILSVPQPRARVNMSNDQIKATLDAFASRGNSIVVTGCGGCGASTVAYNLANTIANIGYTVLLVDMDTEQRAQSYISKDNYNCVDHDGANLMAALNSSSGINAHVSIVRPGFRLLTMGLGGDILTLEKMLEKHKLSRFINLAKTSHNFVIYDLPFKSAVGCASDVTFMADNLVVVMDSSNWGITKTMISLCNIETDDMQDTIFSKGQLLYNKYRGFNKVMGRKVKSAIDISKVMDTKVLELSGDDPGYYFQMMHVCGIINDDRDFESGWFGETQYSDTQKGQHIFIELLKNIVLKR